MSEQPVPETRDPLRDRLERAAPWSPIWPCSGWGLPCLVDYSSSGGLLPHLFTLTADTRPAAVCFLWHCPSKRLTAFLPRVSPTKPWLRGIAPFGVRTFLPGPAETEPKRFSALPKSARYSNTPARESDSTQKGTKKHENYAFSCFFALARPIVFIADLAAETLAESAAEFAESAVWWTVPAVGSVRLLEGPAPS